MKQSNFMNKRFTHIRFKNALGQWIRGSFAVAAMLLLGSAAQAQVTVGGSVYGGGALANVGGTSTVTLNQSGATVTGNVFGGGLGQLAVEDDPNTPEDESQPAIAALVTGAVTVTVNTGTVTGAVFGCNDVNGTPQSTVAVTVNGTDTPASGYAIGGVYGGGNLAHYEPTDDSNNPVVVINGCSSSIEDVFGGGNAAAVTATDVTINGGVINRVFAGGNGVSGTPAHVGWKNTAAAPSTDSYGVGTASATIHGGTINQVFSGSNANGVIRETMGVSVSKVGTCAIQVGDLYGGGNMAPSQPGVITLGCMDENDVIDYLYGGANQADVTGNIVLNITGGRVNNAFGGNNASGTISGTITVNVDMDGSACTTHSLGNVYGAGNLAPYTGSPSVNILRGTVSQNVYGGGKGETAVVTGAPHVTVGDVTPEHSDYQAIVTGSVFGGGDAAEVTQEPIVLVQKCNTQAGYVYGGGNAATVPSTDVTITGGNAIGEVYGGCFGANVTTDGTDVKIRGGKIGKVFGGNNSSGTITGDISVNVNKTSTCDMIVGEVYSGGNLAPSAAGTVTVGCTGDIVDGENGHAAHPENIGVTLEGVGTVYGGANQANIGTEENHSDITVNIHSGIVANVFGGNNTSGTIYGDIVVNIEKNSESCDWYVGNVFGGGNLAAYTGNPAVNIKNGTVSQNVYGGGKGSSAVVTGTPQVTVGDLTVGHEDYEAAVTGDVYGGGDAANVNTGIPVVLIQKCNTSVGYAYGGGNAANVPATSVTVTGGTVTGSVFGGGHGDKDATPTPLEANVTGNTNVLINGGTINQVFGGSNSKGTIGGDIGVTVNKTEGSCDMHITEVYGGGNFAASQVGNITVNCTGTFTDWDHYEGIEYLYGGANQATVTGNIALNVTKGTIKNVFGGNNTSGTISGTITVNVTADECMHLYNVYGAGNLASYTGSPVVNINHGTIDNNVYGGGKGGSATVTGNPVVTIGDNNADHVAIVSGDVYGGGDAAAVEGYTTVTYNDNNASSTVGNLFGGGNAAGVSSTATVTLTSGKILSGIYGGCNSSGNIGGKVTVNVNGGTIGALTNVNTLANVFGGGFGQSTTTSGDVEVNITNGTVNGDVYGGSALGSVNAGSGNTTIVNVTDGTLNTIETTSSGGFPIYNGGNVYGGGLGRKAEGGNPAIAALVNGVVTVNIGACTPDGADPNQGDHTGNAYSGNATIMGNVYGCNNTYGSPQENVTVNIYQTAHPSGTNFGESGYALANVFGGGNEADFRVDGKTATVNVFNCDNTINRTFGGGNAAATNSVITDIKGGRIHEAFGGGNGEVSAADIYGNITLGIHGGIIGQSFSVSNQNGNVTGTATITINNDGCGDVTVEDHFCGGNLSTVYGNLTTVITCAGGMNVRNLYGGCNKADVLPYPTVEEIQNQPEGFYPPSVMDLYNQNPETYASQYAGTGGNVHLTVEGGTYQNVYGGSKGDLAAIGSGHSDMPANIAGNVQLDIYGGTIANAIYGGSHINGSIGGTIIVNVEDKYPDDACALDVSTADVYGGGNLANYEAPFVSGTSGPRQNYPEVNIKNATVKNVFGGALEAQVTGNPQIQLKNKAFILGDVYGGGNRGVVNGNPKVILNGQQTN